MLKDSSFEESEWIEASSSTYSLIFFYSLTEADLLVKSESEKIIRLNDFLKFLTATVSYQG